MALIPGGSFKSKYGGLVAKTEAYCLDLTEVTADAYAICVRQGRCSDTGLACEGAATYGKPGLGDHPINCIDWKQADDYCKAQSKRLPTEDEWEWAARGGEEARPYPWGRGEPHNQLCWSGHTIRDATCAIASFRNGRGRWGLEDMAGNVAEWADGDGDERPVLGSSYYADAPTVVEITSSEGGTSLAKSRGANVGVRCAR
jgi:formylglycine-generating enzyme required for sulfatase activity